MNRPLKILMVLHMPWSRNLGGPRVQLELAEEFQALGHYVEKFDYYDAFPQVKSSRLAELTRPSFAVKAKAFVKANANRFDIIDAHQGNLPFSKQELGIHGLLVARSVGLAALCDEFNQLQKTKWPLKRSGNPIGNLLRSGRHRREKPYYLRSFQTCDLINLPNYDELTYVRDKWGLGDKCAVFPFGLSHQRLQAFARSVQPASIRLANKQVVFIGTWSTRKGSRDWAEIMKRTKAQIPEARFLFLGTGLGAKEVLADLELSADNWIEIVPSYDSDRLPELLSGATVGAFPSYMEGFGFAVLEKLACGLPTISYDIPGPREMLRTLGTSFMTPVGNVEKFTDRLIKLLQIDEAEYNRISHSCLQAAEKFSWPQIARDHLNVYKNFLEKTQLLKK